jgi:hypothetical protein
VRLWTVSVRFWWPPISWYLPLTFDSKILIKIGLSADDTAILSSSQDPHEASALLQNHLNSLSHWFKSWKIKINDSKSSHVTFSLRPGNCPHITFENKIIPHTNEVKYLGLLFDRRLSWLPPSEPNANN